MSTPITWGEVAQKAVGWDLEIQEPDGAVERGRIDEILSVGAGTLICISEGWRIDPKTHKAQRLPDVCILKPWGSVAQDFRPGNNEEIINITSPYGPGMLLVHHK